MTDENNSTDSLVSLVVNFIFIGGAGLLGFHFGKKSKKQKKRN